MDAPDRRYAQAKSIGDISLKDLGSALAWLLSREVLQKCTFILLCAAVLTTAAVHRGTHYTPVEDVFVYCIVYCAWVTICLPWLITRLDGKMLRLILGIVLRFFAADVGVLAWSALRGDKYLLQRGLRLKPLFEPSLSWLSDAGYNIRLGVVIAVVVASTISFAIDNSSSVTSEQSENANVFYRSPSLNFDNENQTMSRNYGVHNVFDSSQSQNPTIIKSQSARDAEHIQLQSNNDFVDPELGKTDAEHGPALGGAGVNALPGSKDGNPQKASTFRAGGEMTISSPSIEKDTAHSVQNKGAATPGTVSKSPRRNSFQPGSRINKARPKESEAPNKTIGSERGDADNRFENARGSKSITRRETLPAVNRPHFTSRFESTKKAESLGGSAHGDRGTAATAGRPHKRRSVEGPRNGNALVEHEENNKENKSRRQSRRDIECLNESMRNLITLKQRMLNLD